MSEYNIISGNQTFQASTYQEQIFKEIEKGVGNLIINACAGSAKTTTIVNGIRYIPKDKKILFVAFNKEIVKKMKNDVQRENTIISTFHSLSFSILNENLHKDHIYPNVNEYKYETYIKEKINKLSEYNETASLRKSRRQYIDNIKKLVDYCRQYLAFDKKEISKVAGIYDITPIRDEISVVGKVLKWGEENVKEIDYTDMIWLPNVLNLTTKKHRYDFIFIDEAQDTTIAEQNIIEKCLKRGARFVAVGDKMQQINVWAGSSEKALTNLAKHKNTKEMELPISYRCPKKVVYLAQKYCENIIPKDDADEGEVNYDASEMQVKDGDMVLCRRTAPLVELFLKYIKYEKKAYIRGNENIKNDYISLIMESNSKTVDRNCITTDGLFPMLYKKFLNAINSISNIVGNDKEDIFAHPYIQNLYDNIIGLGILSVGILNTDELIAKINSIFSSGNKEGIQLSTIHKAKGLEADNVFILNSSLMENVYSKSTWEKQSEDNLIYVAYTRAKKTLNFIKEENNNNHYNGYRNLGNFVNNITGLLKQNQENNIQESLFDKTDFIKESKTITLGEKSNKKKKKETKAAVSNKKNKKQKAGLKFKNLF